MAITITQIHFETGGSGSNWLHWPYSQYEEEAAVEASSGQVLAPLAAQASGAAQAEGEEERRAGGQPDDARRRHGAGDGKISREEAASKRGGWKGFHGKELTIFSVFKRLKFKTGSSQEANPV
jgi:hypothetical protein